MSRTYNLYYKGKLIAIWTVSAIDAPTPPTDARPKTEAQPKKTRARPKPKAIPDSPEATD